MNFARLLTLFALVASTSALACPSPSQYVFGRIALNRNGEMAQNLAQNETYEENQLLELHAGDSFKMNVTPFSYGEETADLRLNAEVISITTRKSGFRQAIYEVEEITDGNNRKYRVTVTGNYFAGECDNTVTKIEHP